MKDKILDYIRTWERRCYSNGIPDHAPHEIEIKNSVPSYRKICLAILKNDHSLKSLGYAEKKSVYYDYYKKIEINKRNKFKQLKLDI